MLSVKDTVRFRVGEAVGFRVRVRLGLGLGLGLEMGLRVNTSWSCTGQDSHGTGQDSYWGWHLLELFVLLVDPL